ncbi:hypothetical protein F52700_8924 [Fusarium sp. NRRL 52700]|nr:hypothetical protein F52700_8924 [Fusarium sp. NRRL 52700]
MATQQPGPCHESDTVSNAAANLIAMDFEDLCSRVAGVFMERMDKAKRIQWTRHMKQQLLQNCRQETTKRFVKEDPRLVLQAMFRTDLDFGNEAASNPFLSSPSLMNARFNEGKKFYESGNLVTAAPLLIIYASDQRRRYERSGGYKGKSHVCRPEMDRSLLCGKLLCQIDPFSYYGPRSLVCSRCQGKSAWPYLPMLFAHLALHKHSRGEVRLPRGFQEYAGRVISEFYSVFGDLAENKLGTLAVASAVMQLIRESNADFPVNRLTLGFDMTWAGSLPYFKSQQELILDRSKTSAEESADIGKKLLEKRYRRIDVFQELDDRKISPAVYERIRQMLLKNGGKLWGQEAGPARSNTQTRFPVLELLVTSTPRLE